MNTGIKTNFLINVLFYGAIFLIIYFSVKFLFAYLFPFIIGTIITVIVQKPATVISNRIKIKKGYCALALVILVYTVLIFLVVLSAFKIGSYVYNVATSQNGLISNINIFVDEITAKINGIFDGVPNTITEQLPTALKSIFGSISQIITNFAKSTVKAMPMFFTGSVVTVIASCYIAKDYERFKASIASVLSKKYKVAAERIRLLFKENILKILVGYIKILLITFIELAVGLILLRTNNAILLALLISLLDLLPVFGTGTILIPWGVYSMLTENYFFGIGILVLYAIIMIVRNIIEPKIIGKQMGLHPLLALIAVFIGLKLFGFIGIFIVPFTAMFVYKMYEDGIFEILFSKA